MKELNQREVTQVSGGGLPAAFFMGVAAGALAKKLYTKYYKNR
ncbi:class IIb bacteriocin, lactobin A/cerein 7B family [Vibrio ulleungensis]|jgi:lactobin A/cerein 7B family class IIb bacteriocin|uniref:Class IIb bacteriocin, lactobin A/cerein 7B family n=1 Tax=Vibrio ulleungensis TaxID=2807619 RepID=A0ABS2HPB8_9VIBR|nr:class IIb bacteriocin, lactobin A/cerein 7B family [Vibrio ulleungensis]MBM7037737.1 class IIb bacteriocin, lactobin A/cerein 7B family [Vibrio ulleungensis]